MNQAQQVQKKKETSVMPLATLEADSHAASGFGNIDAQRDLAIPYINILQPNSPQVNKTKAEFIQGATAGQFFNTVTQELSDHILVLPSYYHLKYVEWVPREKGGGLVQVHSAESGILGKTMKEGNKDVLPNGNYVATTAYHYVVVMTSSGPQNAVVSMTSTQLKKSRRWNSLMLSRKIQGAKGMFTPPSYAFMYKLTTVGESNDQGSWFGYNIELDKMVEDTAIYEQAKSFAKAASSGEVEAKPEEPVAPTKDNLNQPQETKDDSKIPF